jgi:hypothetical protein
MTSTTTLILLLVAIMLMISSGLSKKRLEWRPRRKRIDLRRLLK